MGHSPPDTIRLDARFSHRKERNIGDQHGAEISKYPRNDWQHTSGADQSFGAASRESLRKD
jgi:hypothetical protein